METSKNSNNNLAKIEALLLSGVEINSMMVLRFVGTTEIRHYIAKLRKSMVILDRWVTNSDGKRFKKYWIDGELPKAEA